MKRSKEYTDDLPAQYPLGDSMYGYDTFRVNGVKVENLKSGIHYVEASDLSDVPPSFDSDYRMSKEEYHEFVESTFESMARLIRRKNADYTAGADDPFANFRTAEDVGVNTLRGVAVRFLDKIQRIKSYYQTGNLVAESFEDALLDTIGYAMIQLGLLEEAKRAGKSLTGSTPSPASR